jgi:Primase C terminal 2 (PriCT-2)
MPGAILPDVQFEDHPLCEWPDWLLAEAMKPKARPAVRRDPNTLPPAHHVADLTAALRQLDPRDWQNHDRWLQLMTACRAEGIERDDFIEWSVGDPRYADDAAVIARRWDSLAPKHGGALWAALSEAGIKLTHAQIGQAGKSVGVPLTASQTHISTRNLKSRLISLQRTVERVEGSTKEPGDTLFWAACVCAEIIAEDRRLTPSVATALLLSAAHVNGLLREIGKDEVLRTIANGLRHVELKLLA